MLARVITSLAAVGVAGPLAMADCRVELKDIDQIMSERRAQMSPDQLARAQDLRDNAEVACKSGADTSAQAMIDKLKEILAAT